ncbi:unnamed protein product [Merluccius merluccius]
MNVTTNIRDGLMKRVTVTDTRLRRLPCRHDVTHRRSEEEAEGEEEVGGSCGVTADPSCSVRAEEPI